MSKCDISVSFDRADGRYQPGDIIQGVVHLTANRDVRAKNLTIRQVWKTHGKGNVFEETLAELVKDDQQWTEGATYDFPFSFTAPAMPMSYHGHYLNIDHYIAVRADVPWAIDPKCYQDYLLVPGPTTKADYEAGGDQAGHLPPVRRSATARMLGWIFIPIVLAVLAFAFIAFWWLFAIVAAVFLVRKLMHYYAERCLGDVAVDFGGPCVPGQVMPLWVSFTPRRRAHINGITATLHGQECCVSGSGTNATTHKHELHKRRYSVSGELQVHPGRLVEERLDLPVPPVPAYSIEAGNNKIEWWLDVHVDIRNCPDWRKRYHVRVIPESEGAADPQASQPPPEPAAARANSTFAPRKPRT